MTRQAALFDLHGVLLDSGPSIRATLAAVTTCATGRRTTVADLPPGALHRPRAVVLDQLGVSDPDDACTRWWDGALAAVLPSPFPGVLSGLLALHAQGVAVGVITLKDRNRLPWYLPPALADLLDVVITRQDAPAKPASRRPARRPEPDRGHPRAGGVRRLQSDIRDRTRPTARPSLCKEPASP
ncbi:HAD family hydrolase [Streptomyces sp. NPDC086010]|uniref:HAD family hydrolase n=1 Tax=Streptomyces sp. NPDC086010 TaxID=3365745 RepID=UPI0037D40180